VRHAAATTRAGHRPPSPRSGSAASIAAVASAIAGWVPAPISASRVGRRRSVRSLPHAHPASDLGYAGAFVALNRGKHRPVRAHAVAESPVQYSKRPPWSSRLGGLRPRAAINGRQLGDASDQIDVEAHGPRPSTGDEWETNGARRRFARLIRDQRRDHRARGACHLSQIAAAESNESDHEYHSCPRQFEPWLVNYLRSGETPEIRSHRPEFGH